MSASESAVLSRLAAAEQEQRAAEEALRRVARERNEALSLLVKSEDRHVSSSAA